MCVVQFLFPLIEIITLMKYKLSLSCSVSKCKSIIYKGFSFYKCVCVIYSTVGKMKMKPSRNFKRHHRP